MKYTIYRTEIVIILLMLCFQSLGSIPPLETSRNLIDENEVSPLISPISEADSKDITDISKPLLKIQPFQTPSILYIIADDSSPDPTLDVPLYDFMSINLSYNVIYHSANNSYDYSNFDAIVISISVTNDAMIAALGNAPIPILTMAPSHYDEFSLGSGTWPINSYTGWRLEPISHYILKGEPEVKEIYDVKETFNYFMGFGSYLPEGSELQRLARFDSASSKNYATLVALEKGGLGFDLKEATERRIYWGAPVTDNFLPEAWSFWNKTLLWLLYDDYPGNATINVQVDDPYNNSISNATVELIDSNNLSISWSANTSESGLVIFTNIPWGEYDITATFGGVENNSLSNLQIAPPRTYIGTYSVDYNLTINVTVDEEAPDIHSIIFHNPTLTFFANVTDKSTLKFVYLNLTAKNTYNGTILVPLDNFTMIEDTGNIYYNTTSLEALNGETINITVTYNIIAEDIVGNYFSTIIQTIDLDDPEAPIISSYNAQDYGNGTVVFTANITDENGVQAPVILEITGDYYPKTLHYMFQNESNLWIFKGEFNSNEFLNYTIFSANDTLGNPTGYSNFPVLYPYKNITPIDTAAPRISALSDSVDQHDEGYVFFRVEVDDWSIYQSGVNSSRILIFITTNGVEENFSMIEVGGDRYSYEKNFEYNDNITYWIHAFDNANNYRISSLQGPKRIFDNVIPSVSFSAIEYGNGTIDFFSQVLDWPNNDTSARIYFSNDYFAVDWENESMITVNSTSYHFRITNFPYQTQAIWYYVNALDSENNVYTTQIEAAQSLQLTDIVAPIIDLSYLNSTLIDSEITIVANAIDPYGPIYLLNNSIRINITSVQGNISTIMTFESGTTYTFSRSYQDLTELNITVYVSDFNGNTGYSSLIILVADKAPPTIVQSGIESFINDTLTIFVEVIEGINGSGLLDDNSSITLNYVYKTPYSEIMTWNGTGNYFTYPIPDLNPNDAVFYRFLITDKSNNTIVTEWEQFFIADTFAPIIIDFNATETQKDHISTEVTFWINSKDLFGSIGLVLLNYSVQIDEGWQNYSSPMSLISGDYYERQIEFLPNATFRYQIIVIDTSNNTAKTEIILMVLSGFNPSQFGVGGYGYDIDNPGRIKVWIMVIDIFGGHLHNVNITVTDLNTSTILLNQSKMIPNGLNYSISVKIDYLHSFSYSFVLIDQGVQHGFYDAETRTSTILKMEDNWCPTIHGAGFTKNSDSTYLFWANITDWGSGEDPNTLNVFLNYSLETVTGGGSELSTTYNQERLTFNGTLFVASITFHDSGTLKWLILASDSLGLSDLISGADTPIVLNQISSGIDIEWIIAAVIFTSITFLVIISSTMTIRRRRTKKLTRKQTFVEKLSFLSNIYTIMVSSSVGV
ncbi:MAG: hypothetical protein ACXAAT_03235, partial [Candidatus Hodarchaeales archaeon]